MDRKKLIEQLDYEYECMPLEYNASCIQCIKYTLLEYYIYTVTKV